MASFVRSVSFVARRRFVVFDLLSMFDRAAVLEVCRAACRQKYRLRGRHDWHLLTEVVPQVGGA
jgi:hypothetical protein